MKAMLICALDLVQVATVPVDAHDTAHEEMVFGSSARHGVFEKLGIAHRFVCARPELMQKGRFHVARKFLEIC